MPMFKKSMLVLLAVVALAAGGAFYAGIHGQEEVVELDAGTAPVQETQAKECSFWSRGSRGRPRSPTRGHCRSCPSA